MIDIANENVPEDLVSAGKKSCQYSYRLIESNGSLQLFMLAGPFYIVKVPIVERRQEEEKQRDILAHFPLDQRYCSEISCKNDKVEQRRKKLCSKNFESFIVDCGCLQNIISYDVHVTS
jgi:hypothetical protein